MAGARCGLVRSVPHFRSMAGPSIVWLRQDLRLSDQPALQAAIAHGQQVLPVYIWAPQEEASWEPGGATRWWLHHALSDLNNQLAKCGGGLRVVDASGSSSAGALQELCKELGAEAVFWNRRYEPAIVERDTKLKTTLREQGIEAQSFAASLLFEPTDVRNKSDLPFRVFTPFWKHLQTRVVDRPTEVDLKALQLLPCPDADSEIARLGLLPKIPWDRGFAPFWDGVPSREGMQKRFAAFLGEGAENYPDDRDTPGDDGTSRLAPYLHFGQISPREAWWQLADAPQRSARFDSGVMRQLVWRDFAHHLLFHFPDTATKPLRPEFERFPWRTDEALLKRWERGQTGYPIVDAGMRQLWQTGWMHNRVRMVVASFLVKHLLCGWQEGARWFWDTLVDADLANNTFGWQWTAGCGADAAPYFRIFNPIAQGQRFDSEGAYVRHYVPELAKVPKKFIHCPWEMGELELSGCGVVLDRDYPSPCVDHPIARKAALAAFAKLKEG